MNVHSEPFVPRGGAMLDTRFVSMMPQFSTQTYFDPNQMYYQPLGHSTSQHVFAETDSEWTPVWSDMFQLAEQERDRREFEHHEQVEDSRRQFNQYLCQQRNLIHVHPERQIYINVETLEKRAAIITGLT